MIDKWERVFDEHGRREVRPDGSVLFSIQIKGNDYAVMVGAQYAGSRLHEATCRHILARKYLELTEKVIRISL